MSNKLKIFLGFSYLLILIAFLYFIFSFIEINRLNEFSYYKELQADGSRPTSGVSKIGPGLQGVFSDAALVIMTSSQNPNKRIKFTDVYPTNLSPLQFDVTGSDVAYLEADVTFRYRQFTVVNA